MRVTPPVVGDFGDSFVGAWASVDNALAAVDSGLSLCDNVVTWSILAEEDGAHAPDEVCYLQEARRYVKNFRKKSWERDGTGYPHNRHLPIP